jgi:hypothetical protein
MAIKPRSARWSAIAAGIVAAALGSTALAGSVPASSYLLSAKNLPRGFYVKWRGALSAAYLNQGDGIGPCYWHPYVHRTAGARVVFGVRKTGTELWEYLALGATVKGTRRDANELYAHMVACHTFVSDGITYTISPATPMRTISNGARVGVVVLAWTYKGVPGEDVYGFAQRHRAEISLEYGPVFGANVHHASSTTLSLTLRAVGRLPQR